MKTSDFIGIALSVLLLILMMGGDPPPPISSQYSNSTNINVSTEYPQKRIDIRPIFNDVNTYFSNHIKGFYSPNIKVFSNAINSSCGLVYEVAVYCPADSTVYIKSSIAEDLNNLGFPNNESSIGYVISHEVGHHVQYLLKAKVTENGADCLSGGWVKYTSLANINSVTIAANSAGGDNPSVYGHGSGSTRINQVMRGYNGKFSICF